MSWGIWVIRGIASVAFGVFTVAIPAAALVALVLVFGVYAIVDGGVMIALAFDRRPGRWIYALRGLLGIAAGVATFAAPVVTAVTLYLHIGIWALAIGVIEVIAASWSRNEVPHARGLALTGVLTALFGGILLARPVVGVLALIGVISAFAFVNGITSIAIGVRAHRCVQPQRHLAGATR